MAFPCPCPCPFPCPCPCPCQIGSDCQSLDARASAQLALPMPNWHCPCPCQSLAGAWTGHAHAHGSRPVIVRQAAYHRWPLIDGPSWIQCYGYRSSSPPRAHGPWPMPVPMPRPMRRGPCRGPGAPAACQAVPGGREGGQRGRRRAVFSAPLAFGTKKKLEPDPGPYQGHWKKNLKRREGAGGGREGGRGRGARAALGHGSFPWRVAPPRALPHRRSHPGAGPCVGVGEEGLARSEGGRGGG